MEMVLPDVYNADDEKQMRENNSSSFCYREISGSKTLSLHAQGLAVDINTLLSKNLKKQSFVSQIKGCVWTKNCLLNGRRWLRTKTLLV